MEYIKSLSKVSRIHWFKLIFRSALFIITFVMYLNGNALLYSKKKSVFLIFIWIIFAVEIILRFFSLKSESIGAKKHLSKNFSSTGKELPKQNNKSVIITALVWLIPNLAIGVLHYFKVINHNILLLLSLAYSVCDMICILFFCPFQTWFLKNKCCTDCRIYNWDYPMMFTPFIFINDFYTLSLVFLSLILLVKWEYTAFKYPERFSPVTNACLSCGKCNEKLCQHKKL